MLGLQTRDAVKYGKPLQRTPIQSMRPATIHPEHNTSVPAVEYLSPLGSPVLVNGHATGFPPTPPSNVHGNASHAPIQTNSGTNPLRARKSNASTPINQRSPPTPDTTPPASLSPPQRYPSRLSSSRAESFRTAREDPWISGDDMSSLADTVSGMRLNGAGSREQSLGFGYEEAADDLTPTQSQRDLSASLRREPNGVLDALDRIPDREWDTNLMRNVTVRRKRNKPKQPLRDLERLHQPVQPVSQSLSQREPESPLTPIVPGSFDQYSRNITWPMQRRLSVSSHGYDEDAMNRLSSSSTVVEAVIIQTPPQRQRTLRHVSRNLSLRSSTPDESPVGQSPRTSLNSGEHPPRIRNGQSSEVRSIQKRQMPERRSVTDPKLRHQYESSSLRADAYPLLNGWTGNHGQPPAMHPHSSHRGITNGRSSRNGSLDMSTTLSASSSVNFGSQSSTAENHSKTDSYASVQGITTPKSHTRTATRRALEHALNPVLVRAQSPKNNGSLSSSVVTVVRKRSVVSEQVEQQASHGLSSSKSRIEEQLAEDQHLEDYLTPPDVGRRPSDASGRSFDRSSLGTKASPDRSTMRTPFSQTSALTEAPEISEAKTVNIYPHNNHSLLVVQQLARQSRPSTRDDQVGQPALQNPTLTIQPSTPPSNNSEIVVDSPLQNPRDPPAPPIIHILPATPCSDARNPLDQVGAGTVIRPMTLMQRARRYSDTFIQPIIRTASLRRQGNYQRRQVEGNREREERLHPFWHPRGFWDDVSDSESDWGDADDDYRARLPAGGDTSEIPAEPRGLARVLDGFRGSGGFLIGNSLGVERSGTNSRRHYISLPANFRIGRGSGTDEGEGSKALVQQAVPETRLTKKSSPLAPIDVDARKRSLRRKWKSMGLRIEYIGIGGVRDKWREKIHKRRDRKAEHRREQLRRSIGPRILVQQ